MSGVINADNTVIESLTKQLAATTEENVALKAINAELTKEIESLSVKTESAEPVFEKDGIVYGFHYHRTVLGGQVVTHKEILQSENLQALLIARKSGMIYPKQ